jgi:biotin carboxyl carrier protein
MKFELQVVSAGGEETRIVELERDAGGWRVSLDGRPANVDAVEIAPHTFSILLDGQNFEFSVVQSADGKLKLQTGAQEFTCEAIDSRTWRGHRHGQVEAEGRQQVLAPMPGKVLRLLVKAGDHVEPGQGLFVIEAMKMQNEIRSPKSGTVERILITDGQRVNAGEILCVVV